MEKSVFAIASEQSKKKLKILRDVIIEDIQKRKKYTEINKRIIYNNTTCRHATHFLAGVELIKQAREYYRMASENWAYPTEHSLGDPTDFLYYAEVWVDGMDWQHNYWIIESQLDNPKIYPLMKFENHEEEDKFNEYDFRELLKYLLWSRRNKVCDLKPPVKFFTDEIKPYLHILKTVSKQNHDLHYCYFEHASQGRVHFYVNGGFFPE